MVTMVSVRSYAGETLIARHNAAHPPLPRVDEKFNGPETWLASQVRSGQYLLRW